MGQDSLKPPLSPHRWHRTPKPSCSAGTPPRRPSPSLQTQVYAPSSAQLSRPQGLPSPCAIRELSLLFFLAFPAGVRKFTELRSPLQRPFSPLIFTTFTKQQNYRLPGCTRLSHSSSQYGRFTGHLEGKEGLLNAKRWRQRKMHSRIQPSEVFSWHQGPILLPSTGHHTTRKSQSDASEATRGGGRL